MKNKRILWLIPFIVLLLLNVLSFLGEIFVARINWEHALILRGSTILLDGLFIGIYTNIRIKLRKKLKYNFSYKIVVYLSDTIAALVIFYALYLLRLILFLYLSWIDQISFLIDSIGGLFVTILFGWLLGSLTKNIKRYIKKGKKSGIFLFSFF